MVCVPLRCQWASFSLDLIFYIILFKIFSVPFTWLFTPSSIPISYNLFFYSVSQFLHALLLVFRFNIFFNWSISPTLSSRPYILYSTWFNLLMIFSSFFTSSFVQFCFSSDSQTLRYMFISVIIFIIFKLFLCFQSTHWGIYSYFL